jgi:hypothetical protein
MLLLALLSRFETDESMDIGYARVSTGEQALDLQAVIRIRRGQAG